MRVLGQTASQCQCQCQSVPALLTYCGTEADDVDGSGTATGTGHLGSRSTSADPCRALWVSVSISGGRVRVVQTSRVGLAFGLRASSVEGFTDFNDFNQPRGQPYMMCNTLE